MSRRFPASTVLVGRRGRGKVKRWTLPREEGARCSGAGDRRVLPDDPPQRAHTAPLPRRRPARARDGGPRQGLPLLHRRPDPDRPGHPPPARARRPLPDVRRILRSPDPHTRAALVFAHLPRLESELDRTRAAVASLRRLLTPEPAP